MLEQLRADFALVWKARRDYGQISQIEFEKGKAQAGREVRERTGDSQWMEGTAKKYAQEAESIRRDKARRDRIAQEVRANRM